MGLPVLGRDEDAADSFAVVTMLKIGGAMSDDVLVDAATGWFLSALRDEKKGIKLEFYDAHGLDRQRAYEIVCLMVGSDPARFKTLADKIAMPEERQSTCQGDYSNASWSWNTLLKPHLRAANQPKTPITVTYGKADGDFAAIEKMFRAIRLLETVADQSSDEYVWRRPFTIEMATCGSAGGDWDAATQRVTLCYEFVADLAMLYRQYGEQVQLPMYQATGSAKR
jgi:Putative metallopeptidase